MFLDNYPCTTSSFCHSLQFAGLSSAPAILLLHGFMGSPFDLQWLGKQLNEAGYNVYIPRLPGHGTNAADFTASTWRDWLRYSCEKYIDISAIHERVFVAGHSMGGLLASLIAARFNPEKLILLAPGFEVSDKRLKFAPILKYFMKKIEVEPISFYTQPAFLKAQKDYIGTIYVDKVADFLKLKRLARKNLPYIKAETLTIMSQTDQMVPMTVKQIIENNIKAPKDYLILQKSSHALADDVEREQVAKKIITFLKT